MSGHEFYDYAAKYTPGPVARPRPRAEVTPLRSGRRSSSSPATPTGRSAPRASPGSTSCSPARRLVVSEINTIPGFTPISLFPTLCAEGGYDFAAVCRRVVDLALERDRSRVRHRLTAGGPAAVSRPSTPAPRAPDPPVRAAPGARPGGGVRRTRPVRRASAGLTPVRAGALLARARRRPRPSTASPRRTRSPPGARRSPAPPGPARSGSSRRSPIPDGTNVFTHPGGGPRGSAWRRSRRSAGPRSRSPCRTRCGWRSTSARRCWPGGSARAGSWSTARAACSRSSAPTSSRRPPTCRWSNDARLASMVARRGFDAWTR